MRERRMHQRRADAVALPVGMNVEAAQLPVARLAAVDMRRADLREADEAGVAGEHLLRLFAAQDLLEGLASPEAILDERLVVAEPHTLVERFELDGGAWTPLDAELALDEGLGFQGSVDPPPMSHTARILGSRSSIAAAPS